MNDLSATNAAGATEESAGEPGSAPQAQFEVVAAITASMERDTTLVGNPFKFQLGKLWNLTARLQMTSLSK
ncbi:hypothetical protein [Pseudomonas tremae]|uniref:hypothetical protein n=1 Tax=Pseudomonas tremae TaxID=200454 RepID=UPI001F479576|nr:hypothetical protein [Pseudomonas tremae]MCF5747812.1 hypothetical protein [Pseudomonas tremae]UQB36519.1 hypothetical protein I9H09_24005 [Pseudomonas tremae]